MATPGLSDIHKHKEINSKGGCSSAFPTQTHSINMRTEERKMLQHECFYKPLPRGRSSSSSASQFVYIKENGGGGLPCPFCLTSCRVCDISSCDLFFSSISKRMTVIPKIVHMCLDNWTSALPPQRGREPSDHIFLHFMSLTFLFNTKSI